MTPAVLARKSGVSKTTLYNWFKAERMPKQGGETLRLIADALELPWQVVQAHCEGSGWPAPENSSSETNKNAVVLRFIDFCRRRGVDLSSAYVDFVASGEASSETT